MSIYRTSERRSVFVRVYLCVRARAFPVDVSRGFIQGSIRFVGVSLEAHRQLTEQRGFVAGGRGELTREDVEVKHKKGGWVGGGWE